MTETKFHIMQAMLQAKGMRCLNLLSNGWDLYYIGKMAWNDAKVEEDGYSIIFRADENDFSRYADMLQKADKIKYIL